MPKYFHILLLLGAALLAGGAQAQNAVNGKVLYNTRFGAPNQGCYSCHGIQGSTLVNTNKIRNGANNPTLIQSAINNDTGGMLFLKPYLNASQVADIAAYLGNPGLVGVTTPVAAVSPATLSFAATNVGSSSAAQTVTLSNTGSGALSISAITSSSSAFRITGGTCAAGGSVAAGGNCTVTVGFSPTSAGSASGTLTLTHNASPTTSTVAMSGSGVALTPAASLSPTTLSFTQVVGSSSAAQTVTLSNTGTGPLGISAISLGGAQAAEFAIGAGSTCSAGGTLAAGSSCTVALSFTPAATGLRNAALSVTHNASGSPSVVSLAGTGTAVPQPVIALNQNALSFAAQALGTTSASQAVTVSNTGQAALVLSGIGVSGSNAAEFGLGGSCSAGTSLAVGGSCTVTVSFAPSATGSRSASLAIASNASNGSASVSLAGSGVPAPAPAVTLSPTAVDFGSATVGAGALARSVTLTNSGSASLSLSGITVSGSGFSGSNSCGASLAAGASCAISVGFAPASVAAFSGSLSVASNATGSPHQVSLAGQGVAAALPVLVWSGTPSGAFADTAVGSTSATRSFTLANQGPGAVVIQSIGLQGANAADFVLGGSCAAGASLAANASCTVDARFAPSQIGTRSAELDVLSSGSNPAPLALSGNGAATAQATLALSVPSVSFPVTTQGTPPAPVPVVLANTGTAALNVTAIGFSDPAFGFQPSAQNGCGALPLTLAPGQQCSIDVTLSAAGAGTLSASMTVSSDAAINPQPLAVHAQVDPAAPGAINNVGAGGCSIARPDAPFDPLLPLLCGVALVVLWLRRARGR